MRYGMIGNCKTAALVHESGSIDWFCAPRFDSPSAFGALVGEKAGFFSIEGAGKSKTSQHYLDRTNILVTEHDDGTNAFEIIDYMPRYKEGEKYRNPAEIHRLIRPLRGQPKILVRYRPRLNYASGETLTEIHDGHIMTLHRHETLFLYSSLNPAVILEESLIPLTEEQFLVLSYNEWLTDPTVEIVREKFVKTKQYWEAWSDNCRLPSFHGSDVLRSALTLKLMTYGKTGAIIAAPTTSLPESDGEGRNWDYRFCWLRDASLMLEALKAVGHFDEAKAFIHFLLEIFESKLSEIRILYAIDGRDPPPERILSQLSGYRGNLPVRVGNAAFEQKQNDIFGEILNTIYLYYIHYHIEPMKEDVWSLVRFFVETCAREWREPDAGLWELRHRTEHFTFSKVLSWVALDRGSKIARAVKKDRTADRWQSIAAEIRKDVEENGWSPRHQSYMQAYGSSHVDASLLLMNRYGFLAASDPRWIGTVRKCEQAIVKNGLTYRYTNVDDFGAPQKAFAVACLWMAKALYSIGEHDKAKAMFEKVLSCANHVGLLAENIDFETGAPFGNFPQAYSHMAIINTANLLNQTFHSK